MRKVNDALMYDQYQIIDISQPVGSRTACFPGDTPFSREIAVSYAQSQVLNLTAIKMSPHVGTHADAPVHVYGDLEEGVGMAAALPLEYFLGAAAVIDLSPHDQAIRAEPVMRKLRQFARPPRRLLIKTARQIRYEVFEERYAYLSLELVEELADKGVMLVGIDTPSVDEISSKTLAAHHALLRARMHWLENLDLTGVEEGEYCLVALPLKLTEAEASPVRAVLLKPVQA